MRDFGQALGRSCTEEEAIQEEEPLRYKGESPKIDMSGR